jgi:hypothetical protein
LSRKVSVRGIGVTKGAREAIEGAGGSIAEPAVGKAEAETARRAKSAAKKKK